MTGTIHVPISHVQLSSVPVSDQDKARDFMSTLGFELVSDTEMDPKCAGSQVRPRGSVTSLTLVTWFPTMPPGSLKGTVLESDALESDIANLQGKGVKIGAIGKCASAASLCHSAPRDLGRDAAVAPGATLVHHFRGFGLGPCLPTSRGGDPIRPLPGGPSSDL